MSGDSEDSLPPVKEYGERTLNMGRMYYLLRQECGMEDPWHVSWCWHSVLLTVCTSRTARSSF